jgi:hypothetical protein
MALVVSFGVTPQSFGSGAPDDTEPHVWDHIHAQIENHRYSIQQSAESDYSFVALNPKQRFETHFGAEHIEITPQGAGSGSWRCGMSLVAWGSENGMEAVLPALTYSEENRAELRRGTITEWYINRPEGLEQTFEISSPPSEEGSKIVLEIAVDGGLQPQLTDSGQSILLRRPDGSAVLSYGKLRAWDSAGINLDAGMELAAQTIRLTVSASEARFPITIDPLITLVKKLLPVADKSDQAKFGSALDIDGSTMLVASIHDDENGASSGAVWVFYKDQGGTDSWGLVTKITASDGAIEHYFGSSVSISGDTAIVGAENDDDNGPDSGSAYIFSRNQGGTDSWGQVTKITASDGAEYDFFGTSVSISGDTAIVGAWGEDQNGDESGSAYIFSRNHGGSDSWGQVTKITASDGAIGDTFGYSVSISGDTAIVGANRDDDNCSSSGSAYIFSRNQGGTDSWGQVVKITPSDGAEKVEFGYSVSLGGDIAIVGSPGDSDNGSWSGSAYIFSRNQGGTDSWGQVAKITPSDGAQSNCFGGAVSISGDTAIVGALRDDDNGIDSGSAYIFSRNQGGTDSWGQVTKIVPSDGVTEDRFNTVSISGDTAIVGAWGDDDNGYDSGSAYIFSRNQGGTDSWGLSAKQACPDSPSARADNFGKSVFISGDTAIVGAEGDDDNGLASGAAYIFSRNHGGTDYWGRITKVTASDGVQYDRFGSVSISGDTAIVGARNSVSAYIFSRNQGGADSWGQVTKITGSDATYFDDFGSSVSISGDTAIVGAYRDDDSVTTDSGSAYIFFRDEGGTDSWGQVTKITASDPASRDIFGVSVSISGDTAIVGAPGDDDSGSASGSAYIFSRNQGGTDSWGQVLRITASDGAEGSYFGNSVSISDDTAIVGAPGDDDNGIDSGAAYIFSRNQGGIDGWGQVTKITASDGAESDCFGLSVSISGDKAIVGATGCFGSSSGSSYIFSRNQGGTDSWGQVTKIEASDGVQSDYFGYSVAISGDTAIVGVLGDNDLGIGSGSAYPYTIDPDLIPPGKVSKLQSTSHPLSTPTTSDTIDMTWTAATDDDGVAGYGYEFNTSPSWTCDEVQDTADTSAGSTPLADGSWYFHICAVDNLGNWGYASTAGPYVIDTDPPGVVSNLSSTSHVVNMQTADATIDMSWSAAIDDSGVAGYGYEFSASAGWTCDQVQDTAGTSATSAPLAVGTWYFHICAVDNAGNWGAVASSGQYGVLEVSLFSDGFERGDTSAWSRTAP